MDTTETLRASLVLLTQFVNEILQKEGCGLSAFCTFILLIKHSGDSQGFYLYFTCHVTNLVTF